MSADQQIAVYLRGKVLAQAMTSDCEHVEGKYVTLVFIAL